MGEAVIIGGGLGGLECGCILAKEGWHVTVLEKEAQIGGCLQTYRRAGTTFDTGFHYVGGLGEGEILQVLFKYFDLTSLPWVQIDPGCVDEVHLGDRVYRIPSGWDRFVSYLISQFPDQEAGIRTYSNKIQEIGRSVFDLSSPDRDKSSMGISARDFLCSTFSDPKLIELLQYDVTRIDYSDGTLPLYVYAQIRNSFTQSAWRLPGGGSVIADRLAKGILTRGGQIITGARAQEIIEEDGSAHGVITSDGRTFRADLVISDAHPQLTVRMLDKAPSVRKMFKSRILGMKNSAGALTVSIKLKEGKVKYRDCGIFIKGEGAGRGMMIFHSTPPAGEYSQSLDILTMVDDESFSQWLDNPAYSMDERYKAAKEALAANCIDAACKHVPGLAEAADKVYVSTPLTYRRYTGTTDGSAFGIEKDWQSPLTTFLSPRTPLKNLLLTGQSLNLHGILGVTLTSLLTCSAALGEDLTKKVIVR